MQPTPGAPALVFGFVVAFLRPSRLILALGHYYDCIRSKVYPGKKIDIFEKRERALINLIKTSASAPKLQRGAEEVREAYLGLQKGMIYYAKDVGNIEEIHKDQITKSEAEISAWNALSTDQIIEKYKRQAQQGAAANP